MGGIAGITCVIRGVLQGASTTPPLPVRASQSTILHAFYTNAAYLCVSGAYMEHDIILHAPFLHELLSRVSCGRMVTLEYNNTSLLHSCMRRNAPRGVLPTEQRAVSKPVRPATAALPRKVQAPLQGSRHHIVVLWVAPNMRKAVDRCACDRGTHKLGEMGLMRKAVDRCTCDRGTHKLGEWVEHACCCCFRLCTLLFDVHTAAACCCLGIR